MKSVHLISLGCAKNFVDSEVMLGRFSAAEYVIVDDPHEAEVLVVNTCGFIQPAVEESIDEILHLAELKKHNPQVLLVVTGCMVQRYGEALRTELPEVDIFVDIDNQQDVVRIIEGWPEERVRPLASGPSLILLDSQAPRRLATPPFRAYLKTTEGCDNYCSYCMIPSIRGPLRSRTVEDLVAEAARLESGGVRELSLIAQDLTAYGDDLADRETSLVTLLQALLRRTSIPWVRLLYLYPSRVTPELLQIMAQEPRILPYLDIPMQHASTAVLRAMNRHYTEDQLERLLVEIRTHVPECAIRTTFMVGFPGETERDFELLLAHLRQWRLDHVGVFAYQDEEGSAAKTFGQKVPDKVKEERLHLLMEEQAEISREKLKDYVGCMEPVLVEGVSSESDLLLEGRLRFQAPDIDGCVYIASGNVEPGDIRTMRITEAHTYDLVAEAIETELR